MTRSKKPKRPGTGRKRRPEERLVIPQAEPSPERALGRQARPDGSREPPVQKSAQPLDKRPMRAPRRPDAARFEPGRPKGKKKERRS